MEEKNNSFQEEQQSIYNNYGSYFDKEEDTTGKKTGIISIVFGGFGIALSCLPVIGLIPAVIAIIIACFGLKTVNRGLSVAGLALGIAAALPQILLIALLIGRQVKPF